MGLKKPNQGLKKAEKVKHSDQTSVRTTRPQRREARVRPLHSRTRLAFWRKSFAATSIFVNAFCRVCLFSLFWRNPRRAVDPGYLYEASPKIVGLVLLNKVPKEKTDRRVF